MADATPAGTTEAERRRALTQSTLPVAVLDLETMQLVGADDAAATVTGRALPVAPVRSARCSWPTTRRTPRARSSW